jgi:hypothetical protein
MLTSKIRPFLQIRFKTNYICANISYALLKKISGGTSYLEQAVSQKEVQSAQRDLRYGYFGSHRMLNDDVTICVTKSHTERIRNIMAY